MKRNEIDVIVETVRERERESKRIRKTCSLFDAQKAELKEYIDIRTGYRKKRKEANFTDGYNENYKKIRCKSKIAEEDFFRDVDIAARKAKTFTENSPSFLCALRKRELASERGITLLALIITVVIMIILAAVTINITLGDGGLIDQAKTVAEATVNSAESEQEQLDSLEQELANILAENEEPATIPDTETQVANYADVDGNGTVDGVIYADLAVGGSAQWIDSNGTYTIPKGSGFKKYRVTQESYSGKFGTGKVIAPVDPNSSSGNERFYVMALSDVDSSTHTWYNSAYGNMNDYATYTSGDFGAGEQNTAKMITKWNSSGYGSQNSRDMWGISAVQSGTWNGSEGWYVPSRGEWAAFGDQLDITTSNYSSKGLSYGYWSSSQSSTSGAWLADFLSGCMRNFSLGSNNRVRLGTTY